jgi:hypothetical protein
LRFTTARVASEPTLSDAFVTSSLVLKPVVAGLLSLARRDRPADGVFGWRRSARRDAARHGDDRALNDLALRETDAISPLRKDGDVRDKSLCTRRGDVVLAVALEPGIVARVQPIVLAIGIGARTGNGVLLCVLTWLVLEGRGASIEEASLLTGAVCALFLLGFAALAVNPQEAVIGYKG